MANSSTYSKVTPYIRPISVQGGTFYTFSSAGEDFTLAFNENSARSFKFSKFGLLRIPDISDNSDRREENLLRLTAIPGANKRITERGAAAVNLNTYFAESFQNYCLNLETSMLSRSTYDATEPASVAERVFFKWLKELGAIRFTPSGTKFTEEAESANYKRVVQYIGDIDLTNNYSGAVNSYNEVYVHIPTEAGNFPNVYFNTVQDNNYAPGMSVCRNDADPLNNGFIAGRHYNDYHPIANFDTHAYYDLPFPLVAGQDVRTNSFSLMKAKTGVTNPTKESDFDNGAWWYLETSNQYCYLTQNSRFDDAANEYLALGDPTNVGNDGGLEAWTVFKRSKLDGIQVEFDHTSYGGEVNSLLDVATGIASQDFEFNCILVYYDLVERTPADLFMIDGQVPDFPVGENPPPSYDETLLSTNLFGVLFLDNVNTTLGGAVNESQIVTSLGTAKIPSLTKCIPNKQTKLNGNSYGFKLNIKLDVSNANSGVEVETYISDSNTFSLDAFAGALNGIHDISGLLTAYFKDNMIIDERLRRLESVASLNSSQSLVALEERVTQIERYMTQNEIFLQVAEKKDLVDLINQNYTMLNNLLTNNTSVNVAFDLSTLKQGPGVILTRDAVGVTIESSEVDFNFGDHWKIYPPTNTTHPDEVWMERNRNEAGQKNYYEYETELKPLKNYIRLDNDKAVFTPTGDFYLRIKDGMHSWSTGQSMRIYFADEYPMVQGETQHNFYVVTDYMNILNRDTNYKAIMATITGADFASRGNKPIIEIHCVDAKTFTFIVDFLN